MKYALPPAPLVLGLFGLALACGSDDASDSAITVASLGTSGDGDGDSGDGDPGDGDPTAGDGDPTSGTGDPCSSGAGCYPDPVIVGAGLSSRAPLGCAAGGLFTSPWNVDIAGGGSIDAAKSTPLAHDFDGDGAVDILIAARKTAAPRIYPGNGDGTFGAPTTLSGIGLFVGGWGLDAGDIDGDGGTDIGIGDHTEGALAWLHAGGLNFTPTTTGLPQGSYYSGSGLGDIDSDGDLDLVLGGDQFGGGYHVATYQAGSWTQVTPAGLPALGEPGNANVGSAMFVDYDGDGDMDMISVGQGGPGVSAFVYENGGDGSSWTARGQYGGGSIQSLGNPVQGAIGDVDCDGDIDLAAGGSIYVGDGAGAWSLGANVDAADLSQLGDVNGDGWLDLVTHGSEGLRLYLGDGTGTSFVLDSNAGLPDGAYVPPGVTPVGEISFDAAYGLDLADLDQNGRLDIIRSYKLRDSGVFGDSGNLNVLEVWVR